jgi:type II secretory pathway pseudopilin PulG
MARCRTARRGGFAYLWLLMAVAMMGLGAAMALEVQQTLGQRDREQELVAIGKQYRSALASYVAARPGAPPPAALAPQPSASVSTSSTFSSLASVVEPNRYPESLDDLLKDQRFPGIRRHLRKVFVDPMTGKPEWGLVLVGGRITGIHSLSEEMPLKQDGFEPGEEGLAGAQSYSQWIFSPSVNLAPPVKP